MDLSLEQLVRIARAFGVSTEMARYRVASHGVLSDEQCRILDAEIAQELHIELAERLEIAEVDDTISAAAALLPRVPDALRASPLGQFLAGELDANALAVQLHQSSAAIERMLVKLGLDGLAVTPFAGR
jgi:hypothetical protein